MRVVLSEVEFMRFVVLVDIYGNLDVLEVVLWDMVVYGFEMVVNLGDFFSGLFNVRKIVDILMECDFLLIWGNYDWYLIEYD